MNKNVKIYAGNEISNFINWFTVSNTVSSNDCYEQIIRHCRNAVKFGNKIQLLCPENFLHPGIQEKLIDNILEIEGVSELEIFTNSPSIILNGWQGNVIEP